MKVEIHKTKVRLDREALLDVIAETKADFLAANDPKRLTKLGRSLFSRHNNIKHMYDRIFTMFDTGSSKIVEVIGEAEPDACARVYYKPSLTSLAAIFRKAIVPINPKNHFLYFDLAAAEFFLACYFAGEKEVVEAYLLGEDIYDACAKHFPKGTPRNVYKTVLIASVYGGTPYSTAKRVGISEAQAERLHNLIKVEFPALEAFKTKIKNLAKSTKMYRYPKNWSETEFEYVPYKENKKTKLVEYQENLAVSVYIQSALGHLIQQVIKLVEIYTNTGEDRTILSVFDSILIEVSEKEEQFFRDNFTAWLFPLRIGKFSVGKSYYEAYKNENNEL